jgi:tetratricopeptide (TPR) repeat protein
VTADWPIQGTVAIDRDETLKQAEKLVKVGRLDQALAEYERVLAESPDDWKTVTTAADLYLRANQPARATALFNRQADHLAAQGFLPRAEAFYKRVLKIEPLNEHTLDRLAGIAIKSGITVEARSHLTDLARARQARGDAQGAAAALLKIGALDSADFGARREAARAAASAGSHDLAVAELQRVANDLDAAERPDEAVDVLREAVTLAPADQALRERLLGVLLARSARDAARALAKTPEDWAAVAASYEQAGDLVQALTVVDEGLAAAGETPGLGGLRARLLAALGDHPGAQEQITSLGSVDDPEVQRMQLGVWLTSGQTDRVRELLSRWQVAGQLDGDAMTRLVQTVPAVEWPLAEFRADEAFAGGDGKAAATILEQFVAGHPGHLWSLAKLIEVAVDAGLDTERTAAQDALCGAYLAAGHGAAARVIAEDLVARAPEDARFRERLRQAMVLSGGVAAGDGPVASDPFRLAHGAIDLGAFLGDDQDRTAEAQTGTALTPEVDLSAVIDGWKPHTLAAVAVQKGSSMPDGPDSSNLDDVFRDFRDEVSRQNAVDQAEQHYKVALTYRDMGMIDDAVRELEQAAKSPRLRFDASALLARLLRDRGEVASAVEWFERGAEAPAPTPEAGRQLLYELGQALEESSETSRALAVYLELQADARDYRDVTARVDRLSRMQTES